MLKVQLFGSGSAKYDDCAFIGFPHHRPFQLLCYLLLHPHLALPREYLAEILWDDGSVNDPAKCLRNVMWRLRRAFAESGADLDNYIHSTDGNLIFAPQTDFWLDLEVFVKTVSSLTNKPQNSLDSSDILRLEQACALYKGDLLQHSYFGWCETEREHARSLYLAAMTMLLRHFRAQDSPEDALRISQQMIMVDPGNEYAHQEIMMLHWLMGSRTEAIEHYRKFAQYLMQEIDASPATDTQELFQTIQDNQPGPTIHWGLDPLKSPAKATDILPLMKLVQRMHSHLDIVAGLIKTVDLGLNEIDEGLKGISQHDEGAMVGPG